MEMDANKFAYKEDNIAKYIIKLCQALTEFAYQNSIGIIDNYIFRQKEKEIYWAINQVLEKNNKVKVSFKHILFILLVELIHGELHLILRTV